MHWDTAVLVVTELYDNCCIIYDIKDCTIETTCGHDVVTRFHCLVQIFHLLLLLLLWTDDQ